MWSGTHLVTCKNGQRETVLNSQAQIRQAKLVQRQPEVGKGERQSDKQKVIFAADQRVLRVFLYNSLEGGSSKGSCSQISAI